MSKALFTITAAIGVALAAAPATSHGMAANAGVKILYGHWQIVGVAVPNDGVQALTTDDPSYMGRRLTFTASRLSWDKPGQSSTEAPCDRPAIKPVRRDADPDARAAARKIGGPALRAFSVSCAAGPWGPNDGPFPTLLTLPDGTLGLWWFDNALLKLRRVG